MPHKRAVRDDASVLPPAEVHLSWGRPAKLVLRPVRPRTQQVLPHGLPAWKPFISWPLMYSRDVRAMTSHSIRV